MGRRRGRRDGEGAPNPRLYSGPPQRSFTEAVSLGWPRTGRAGAGRRGGPGAASRRCRPARHPSRARPRPSAHHRIRPPARVGVQGGRQLVRWLGGGARQERAIRDLRPPDLHRLHARLPLCPVGPGPGRAAVRPPRRVPGRPAQAAPDPRRPRARGRRLPARGRPGRPPPPGAGRRRSGPVRPGHLVRQRGLVPGRLGRDAGPAARRARAVARAGRTCGAPDDRGRDHQAPVRDPDPARSDPDPAPQPGHAAARPWAAPPRVDDARRACHGPAPVPAVRADHRGAVPSDPRHCGRLPVADRQRVQPVGPGHAGRERPRPERDLDPRPDDARPGRRCGLPRVRHPRHRSRERSAPGPDRVPRRDDLASRRPAHAARRPGRDRDRLLRPADARARAVPLPVLRARGRAARGEPPLGGPVRGPRRGEHGEPLRHPDRAVLREPGARPDAARVRRARNPARRCRALVERRGDERGAPRRRAGGRPVVPCPPVAGRDRRVRRPDGRVRRRCTGGPGAGRSPGGRRARARGGPRPGGPGSTIAREPRELRPLAPAPSRRRRQARPSRPLVHRRAGRRVALPADVPPGRARADALRRGLPRADGSRVPAGLALRAAPRDLRVHPSASRQVRDRRRARRVRRRPGDGHEHARGAGRRRRDRTAAGSTRLPSGAFARAATGSTWRRARTCGCSTCRPASAWQRSCCRAPGPSRSTPPATASTSAPRRATS